MNHNYATNPAPPGLCPVCWHRHGRSIGISSCEKHTNDEREFMRLKEKQGVDCEN